MTNASAGQPNYPGNSNKSREAAAKPAAEKKEKPQLEKVISGEVVERKKPLGKRIVESFTGDDSKSVGHFVLFDVVLPTTKQLISDVVSQGIERLLFGENAVRTQHRGGYRPNYTGSRPSQQRVNNNEPRAISQRARATHDFNEIVIASRPEAQKVLDDITAAIEQFDVATVSDLYDLVGITGSFQDDKWGWYDLRGARIVRVREGYLLDLPKPEPVE